MSEALFQIGVKALIRNEKGEILVEGKRRAGQAVTYDFPGGRIDEGENLESALRRELKEEIGLEYSGPISHVTTTLSKLYKETSGGQAGLIIILYSIKYDASHEIVLGDEEESFAWVSPQVAAKHIAFKYDDAFCRLITELT